ncbi:MAG: DNA replication and repair protein RecF [Proteobacteria bacterium]|nr:DNA replication and repair protein RecF [Pseudomonadota bacterium]
MVINSIFLWNFRNYRSLELEFSSKINFIYGRNGQGKTNIIESIYYLTHLRSFRTNKINFLYRDEENSAQIKARLTKQTVSHQVSISLNDTHKKVFVDEKSLAFSSDYIKRYFSILFAPDLLAAFKEYPLERRGFFDRILTLIDRNYINYLKDFNRIKKQKNILLRDNRTQEIKIWNKLLSGTLPEITRLRRNLVESVNLSLTKVFKELTDRDDKLEIHYQCDLEDKVEEKKGSLLDFLNSKIEKEVTKGYSIYGPHKDDFWMTINGKRDRVFFSQGEYRISFLALQLVLNQMTKDALQFSPIILLDDIFSELDKRIYNRTLDYIASRDNQVFITSTAIPEEYKKIGKGFEVEHGTIVN